MYLVLETTEDLVAPTSQKTKVTRSYSSKEAIITKFIETHRVGHVITEQPKLIAYGHIIADSEVLAVNNTGGRRYTLEVLHIDQVKEI